MSLKQQENTMTEMPVSDYAPSPERTADLMTKAMEQIGETAKRSIAEIIDAHKAETDHMQECFLHFQEEIVTFVEKAKEEVRASATRCNRLREAAENMMVEFRASIPRPIEERELDKVAAVTDDLRDEIPGFLRREREAPPRRLLTSVAVPALQAVGLAAAVVIAFAMGLPRV